MKPVKKVARYGPPHFNKDGHVSVWAAVVPPSRIPGDYFEERYGDEEVPLTRFYGDFGFGYFDHDSVDTNAAKGRGRPVEDLIGPCSFSSSFVGKVAAAAEERGIAKTHFVVLLYDFKYDPKKTQITRSPYMEFLGSFRYDEEAPSAVPSGDEAG